MKTTPWFSGAVAPVHVGVYERKLHANILVLYALWDGSRWLANGPTVKGALRKDALSNYQVGDKRAQWRGLTQDYSPLKVTTLDLARAIYADDWPHAVPIRHAETALIILHKLARLNYLAGRDLVWDHLTLRLDGAAWGASR